MDTNTALNISSLALDKGIATVMATIIGSIIGALISIYLVSPEKVNIRNEILNFPRNSYQFYY